MNIKKYIKAYGMSVVQVLAVFLLYSYVMSYTDTYTAKMFKSLNLVPAKGWIFLVVEIISMYIALPVLWRLCLQRSILRKQQLAGLLSPYLTLKESIKETFVYRAFWMESLPILFICSMSRYTRANVMEMLGISSLNLVLQYLLCLVVFALPLVFVFLYIEAKQRVEWAREWYYVDEGILRRFREGEVVEEKFYFLLAMNLGMYLLGMLLLPNVLCTLMAMFSAFTVFSQILPQILITLGVIAAFWLLIRVWRSYRKRRYFISGMKKLCREHGLTFTYRFSLIGLFTYTAKTEFTVTGAGKHYYGALLPVPGSSSQIYFSAFEGIYRFGRKMFLVHVNFPKHDLKLDKVSAPDANARRVIVLTRRPYRWILGNQHGGHVLDNDSILKGRAETATLYDIEGFLNTVNMDAFRYKNR